MSMFGFFKKKQPLGREELREEFERFTSTLRHADDVTQIAVGYSINMETASLLSGLGALTHFSNSQGAREIITSKASLPLKRK